MIVLENPNPFAELAAGAAGLVLTIFIHGIGVRRIMRASSAELARFTPTTPAWRVNVLFAGVIAAIVALHLLETLAFAVALYQTGILPTMRDAYYAVLGSYTTVSSGSAVLPPGWRLIGPIIAMAGLFTFGWTASLLVAIMSEITHLDRAQALRDARDERGPSSD
jgi:hypothetical protein